jgi:hypothetical protein
MVGPRHVYRAIRRPDCLKNEIVRGISPAGTFEGGSGVEPLRNFPLLGRRNPKTARQESHTPASSLCQAKQFSQLALRR